MGNRQTSWQNKHRRRDSFVIEGRRPPWAKLPMWNGRAFKRVLKNSPDGTGKFLASVRPVLTALVAVLVFSFILIPQKSEGRIYAPKPPSSPHTRNAQSATTMAYLRLDPWPLAMAPQPIRLGSWPLPAPSLGTNPRIHGHWLQGGCFSKSRR